MSKKMNIQSITSIVPALATHSWSNDVMVRNG